jgi:hypothetical protein
MSPRLKPPLSCLLVTASFVVILLVGLSGQPQDTLEVVVIAAFGAIMLLWVYELGRDRAEAFGRGPPFPLDCAVIPRQDATSDELKELGLALGAWWRAVCATPNSPAAQLDEDALHDLLAGELPQPFGLRLLGWLREPDARRRLALRGRLTPHDVTEALRHARNVNPAVAGRIPRAELRAVFIGLSHHTESDVRRLVASLRAGLPADLVADILIDGQSWDDPPEPPG